LIVILAWFVVISFGLVMCRLAARSDDAHLVEVAEWMAARRRVGDDGPQLEAGAEEFRHDAPSGRYRATG
jgi:hypothetical protein